MDVDETGGRELCGMTQKERQERSREEIYQAALEESSGPLATTT